MSDEERIERAMTELERALGSLFLAKPERGRIPRAVLVEAALVAIEGARDMVKQVGQEGGTTWQSGE